MIVACIPAYNEEKTIAKVVLQTMKQVDRVFVCDDGSGDLTGEIAGALGAVGVRHERDFGYGLVVGGILAEKSLSIFGNLYGVWWGY